jgi:hypothetical protein
VCYSRSLTGYAWGVRDAHDLIADAASALGDPEPARKHRVEADALRTRLRVPGGYVRPNAKSWRSLDA